MSNILFWKDGLRVAKSSSFGYVELTPSFECTSKLKCYYFPRISLYPQIVWSILGGTALNNFLDFCTVDILNETIKDLRYVHGRSELIRGNPVLSTILLAKTDGNIPEESWFSSLPSIYQQYVKINPPIRSI